MVKQKVDQLTVSYDKDADVLYISEGRPRKAIGEMMPGGVIVRRDPKTKEVIGFTIVDFMDHFTGSKAQRIPLKVHFSAVNVG